MNFSAPRVPVFSTASGVLPEQQQAPMFASPHFAQYPASKHLRQPAASGPPMNLPDSYARKLAQWRAGGWEHYKKTVDNIGKPDIVEVPKDEAKKDDEQESKSEDDSDSADEGAPATGKDQATDKKGKTKTKHEKIHKAEKSSKHKHRRKHSDSQPKTKSSSIIITKHKDPKKSATKDKHKKDKAHSSEEPGADPVAEEVAAVVDAHEEELAEADVKPDEPVVVKKKGQKVEFVLSSKHSKREKSEKKSKPSKEKRKALLVDGNDLTKKTDKGKSKHKDKDKNKGKETKAEESPAPAPEPPEVSKEAAGDEGGGTDGSEPGASGGSAAGLVHPSETPAAGDVPEAPPSTGPSAPASEAPAAAVDSVIGEAAAGPSSSKAASVAGHSTASEEQHTAASVASEVVANSSHHSATGTADPLPPPEPPPVEVNITLVDVTAPGLDEHKKVSIHEELFGSDDSGSDFSTDDEIHWEGGLADAPESKHLL